MNGMLLTSFALSLALTLTLETGFFILTGKRDKKDMLLVLLVNILTNPAVVLLYWQTVLFTDWNAVLVTILLELFAIGTEGYYYKKYGRSFRRPYFFSFAANTLSFWTGWLIQRLILGGIL